jgi:hypothetical protein
MATKSEIINQAKNNVYQRVKQSTLRTIKADLKRAKANEPKDKKGYMYLVYTGVIKGLNKRLHELEKK